MLGRCWLSMSGHVCTPSSSGGLGKRLQEGDVVGIGFWPSEKLTFVTVNGEILKMFVRDLDVSAPVSDLRAAIRTNSNDVIVVANFGGAEFACEVRCMCNFITCNFITTIAFVSSN